MIAQQPKRIRNNSLREAMETTVQVSAQLVSKYYVLSNLAQIRANVWLPQSRLGETRLDL